MAEGADGADATLLVGSTSGLRSGWFRVTAAAFDTLERAGSDDRATSGTAASMGLISLESATDWSVEAGWAMTAPLPTSRSSGWIVVLAVGLAESRCSATGPAGLARRARAAPPAARAAKPIHNDSEIFERRDLARRRARAETVRASNGARRTSSSPASRGRSSGSLERHRRTSASSSGLALHPALLNEGGSLVRIAATSAAPRPENGLRPVRSSKRVAPSAHTSERASAEPTSRSCHVRRRANDGVGVGQ